MPISQRLYERVGLSLLAAAILALVFISALSVWLVHQNRTYAGWVGHTDEVLTAIARLRWQVRAAESGQRGFLLTRDPHYAEIYDAAVANAEARADGLKALVADNPEETARAGKVAGLVREKLSELAGTMRSGRAGAFDEALAAVKTNLGFALMDDIDHTLDAMVVTEAGLRAARDAAYESGNRFVVVLTLAGVVLALSVGGGLWLFTRRYLDELRGMQAALATANAGLEQRVSERTAALLYANDEIQRFAYIVSHDLRSPLVNVMGFTAELEVALAALKPMLGRVAAADAGLIDDAARHAVEEDLPEAIGFIRTSALKMDRLIRAILQLSREGRRVMAPETLDLGELVGGIAGSLRSITEARGVEITVGSLPRIVSDRLAVEQILSNLIENAVKYLSPDRPGRIRVAGRAIGALVEIEVADNGRGIDAKDAERIFELFRRAGAQDQAGEGIGLAHVRTLARRLGGTVTCRSTLGEGSTFTLSLPRKLPHDHEGKDP